MDMDLIPRIPINAERAFEQRLVHHPRAFMPVEIGFAHLHELRIDCPVGEKLDLVRGHAGHAGIPGNKIFGVPDHLGIVVIGRDDAFAIGDEGPAEGHVIA